MPKVGETWRTRVGPYTVRLIADDAVGQFPLVGLIRIGDNDVAWNWTPDGRSRDLWDSGFDLTEQAETDYGAQHLLWMDTVGGEHD